MSAVTVAVLILPAAQIQQHVTTTLRLTATTVHVYKTMSVATVAALILQDVQTQLHVTTILQQAVMMDHV